LGDPPLLVGFLRGVPFFWPLAHLALSLIVLAAPVLGLCYGIDRNLFRGEPRPTPEKLAIRGGLNIALLILLVTVIPFEGIWHPGPVGFLSFSMPGEQFAAMLLEIVCIVSSELGSRLITPTRRPLPRGRLMRQN